MANKMKDYAAMVRRVDPLDPLSYNVIKNTLSDFRRAGTRNSEYNNLDQPEYLFFKIIFHFWNGDSYGDINCMQSGLLAPTWTWEGSNSSYDAVAIEDSDLPEGYQPIDMNVNPAYEGWREEPNEGEFTSVPKQELPKVETAKAEATKQADASNASSTQKTNKLRQAAAKKSGKDGSSSQTSGGGQASGGTPSAAADSGPYVDTSYYSAADPPPQPPKWSEGEYQQYSFDKSRVPAEYESETLMKKQQKVFMDNDDTEYDAWTNDKVLTPHTAGGTVEGSFHNSAYNFLIRNDELERAEKLKQFITLLSTISTYSPWYFQSVEGLDGVIERPFKYGAETYNIEAPKQIVIKCLPDAMDNRIATLLDLYRDVAFSYIWNKEILPANLRKFDMSIYIFEAPIENLHYDGYDSARLCSPADGSKFAASYKCFELHECEIDYNAVKNGYSSLNNAEGFAQAFEIPITVNRAYESRYNQYIDRLIGDMAAIDMIRCTYTKSGYPGKIFADHQQVTDDAAMTALAKRIAKYETGGFGLTSIVDNLTGNQISGVVNELKLGNLHYDASIGGKKLNFGKKSAGGIDLFRMVDDLTGKYASSFVSSQLLGNIYKNSIGDLEESLSRIAGAMRNGNVGGVSNGVQDMVQDFKNGWTFQDLGSLHDRTDTYGRRKESDGNPPRNGNLSNEGNYNPQDNIWLNQNLNK